MSDLLSDDEAGQPQQAFLDFSRLKFELRTYYLLLLFLSLLFFATATAFIAFVEPVYMATALVGPADNSDQPFGMDAGGLVGGAGAVGGLAKHLHVGGLLGQGGDDTFNEYISLLTSTRLAAVLVDKDHILPAVFADEWDAANKRWFARDNALDQIVDFLKRVLHRPVKAAPDVDDLMKFFDTKLTSDLSLETNFATVTLKFDSPAEAERILNLILLEADNIIRQDKKRDVSARIAYLNDALEHLSLADQKPAMIEILSEQQQEMMMIESDHRYASILIDPPHAPLKPTSPAPLLDAAVALALSCFAWLGAVRLTPRSGRWRRILDAFARPRVRRSRSSSTAVAGTGAPISG